MLKIGIDMGGTNLRAALVDEDGIREKIIVPCPADAEEPETVLEVMAELIGKLYTDKVESIGIGVPSVVDVEKGIVYNVANIPCWKEVHLSEFLEKRFPGTKVYVNNDANCFALGEATYGAAKGMKNVVGLSLGTGTGAGIVIEGKIFNGANVGAGEVGYLPYLDSFYENYTCGCFFKRQGLDAKKAAALAREGDKDMIACWNEFGKHVGSLIKSLLLTYDPQSIVIGGGMSAASDLYELPMREEIKDFYYPQIVKTLDLQFTSTPDVALLGAAALCNI